MFGALTSLTGGGGMSASGGDATSGTGEQSTGNNGFGNFSYNTGGSNNPWMLIGLAAVVAVVMLRR